MAIEKHHPHKSPSQNPVDFYKSKPQGGKHGTPSSVPEQLKGGPMREKITGTKDL